MRDFKNIDEVVDFVNENNYWYNGNRFESFDELSKSANEHFDVCDVETHLVKNEKYFDLDSQNTLIFGVSCVFTIYFLFYKQNYFYFFISLFVFVLNLKIGTRNINRIEKIRNCIVGYIQKTWYNKNINELEIEYNKWKKKC